MGLGKNMNFNVELMTETGSEGMNNSHIHDYYEIYYLLEGSRRITINNTLFDIEPQDVMLINKNNVHISEPNTKRQKYSRYLLTFDDTFLNSFGKAIDKVMILTLFDDTKLHISNSAHNRINMLFQKAISNLPESDVYSQQIAGLTAIDILVNLCRCQKSQEKTAESYCGLLEFACAIIVWRKRDLNSTGQLPERSCFQRYCLQIFFVT